MTDYKLIQSNRKTIALIVEDDGTLVVRAPYRCSPKRISDFIEAKQSWIRKKQAQCQKLLTMKHGLTEEQRQKALDKACILFPKKVACYAEKMNVSYGRITIRDQKTRWGSCSSKGNLNFNWRLVLAPEHVLDYVVVHELAHRLEMNHSKAFYQIVASVLPDYKTSQKWLRQYGSTLL